MAVGSGRVRALVVLGASVVGAAVGACGSGAASHGPNVSPPATIDAGPGDDAGDAGEAGPFQSAVTVTVDATSVHQTMVGFGASLVYEVNLLSDRNVPDDDIYQVLFADLGLDVLRIANWYQNQLETGASPSTPFSDMAGIKVVQNATAALGHPPKILMSSWSPPSFLKSTGDTKDGGTLVKQGGAFAYAPFAAWWTAALGAYAGQQVVPDYLSIQNEPDFTATYESCRFDATEGTNAGYGKALDAVYGALGPAGFTPKIVAPEITGIARSKVQSYLAQVPPGEASAVAHHLYNGGATGVDPAPDSFATAMAGVETAAAADGLPIFMTEFSPTSPTMFDTAWMIHDAVVNEGVSAYLYWELVWGAPAVGSPPTGLLTLESPYGTFVTPKGYTINDVYYALKHFAKWVDPDFARVDAASSAPGVKASAFVSSDGTRLTVVVLNADPATHALSVDPGAFAFGTATAYRSSGAAERTAQVPLGDGNSIDLPAQSIVTLTFTP
ncbi:MAG TPA: glycoside hydrolase family 30 beta sandwich domain-containing protein [Polyangiaceae bacterium]